MLKKDGGEVKIFDKDPWDNAVELHKKIAYIPGDGKKLHLFQLSYLMQTYLF
jgi:ABC-type multidrug transport system ATPase subunit